MSKTDSLTEAQKFALYEACRVAFLHGWNGKSTTAKNSPELHSTLGTKEALIRKEMVYFTERTNQYKMKYRTPTLTAKGIKVGLAEIERRGGEDPREVYKRREEKRKRKEAEEKARQTKVAGLLTGLRIETGGKTKTNLAASIKRGEFPRLDLENLEAILDHVTS